MTSQNIRERISKNFIIIWLNPKGDKYQIELQHLMDQVQWRIHSVKTFINTDDCVDYLTDIENEKAVLIVTSTLAQRLIPLVKDIQQLYSIYVLSNDETQTSSISHHYKVKDVFNNIKSLCIHLKKDIHQTDINVTPISIVSVPSVVDLNQLNSSFMYSQLLKDILLKMEYGKKEVEVFIELCLIKQVENESAHRLIDEFEANYISTKAIYWYTRDCFIYSMLNQALREQNIDIIHKMGFFIRDLHRQIEHLFSNPNNQRPSKVYRGQGMFNAEFETLRKSTGGLLAWNSFLSTSIDGNVAFMRADSARDDPELTGVLFRVEIDPFISTTPYASVDKDSYYRDSEKEILFSMHTVFRIIEIKQIKNRLWKVKLALTRDTDEDLNRLTNHIRKEIGGQTVHAQLANLMRKMSEFDKAEEAYKAILETTSDTTSLYDDASLHNIIGHILTQKNDLSTALVYLNKGLEKRQRFLPANDPDLAASYNNIGELYQSRGEFSTALVYHKKAFEICQNCLPSNWFNLSVVHNNIGEVHRSMGDVPSALLHHEKALKIRQENLPPTHPELAVSYNNIGLVHQSKGQFATALPYLEKALEIIRKSLPPNHPDLATSLNNIGEVQMSLHNYRLALLQHQGALKIQEKSLPPTHPDLATSYKHIGMVHHSMGDHSTALTNYKKALEIFEKSLPSNHVDIGRSHSNIGLLFQSMRKDSLALTHHEKALKILQVSLPADHMEVMILPSIIRKLKMEINANRDNQRPQLPREIRDVVSRTFQSNDPRSFIYEDELD